MEQKIDSVNVYRPQKKKKKTIQEDDKVTEDSTQRGSARLIEFPKGEYRTNGRNLSTV